MQAGKRLQNPPKLFEWVSLWVAWSSLLYRLFYGNVSQVQKQLYLLLVWPHLEYSCHVWNPKGKKKAHESMQTFAHRIASACWDELQQDLLPLPERMLDSGRYTGSTTRCLPWGCTLALASSPGPSQLFNVACWKSGRAWESTSHAWVGPRVE